MEIDHDLGKIYNSLTNIDPGNNTLTVSGTSGIVVPAGIIDERIPVEGVIRRNTETGFIEVYSNGQWINIKDYSASMLPSGGFPNEVLLKNSSTDYDASWSPITVDMAPQAKQLIAFVKNETQEIIPKGMPVYQNGNVGNSWTIAVGAADAADPLKMPAIGVLNQPLAPGATGELIVLGEIRDVDTSGFSEGESVYVAAGGGYSNIKPIGTNVAVQFLGIVTKIHATNGGGYVTGTGTFDLFRGDLTYFEGWDGTTWRELANRIHQHAWTDINNTPTTLLGYGITDAVNKAGDSMTGSLSLPKTMGEGLLVDNGYAWMDIIGDVTPKTLGTNAAKQLEFYGPVKLWAHPVGSYGDLLYHVPHEYAPNTNIFIHVHWGHNGTNISGTFKVNFWASFAKRDGLHEAPIATSLTVSSVNITNTPQYFHRVDEIQFSMVGGSSAMLNTSTLEVDGVIKVHYEIDTIPSITGSISTNLPFIHTIDVHMQSTGIGTANKDPNFYI